LGDLLQDEVFMKHVMEGLKWVLEKDE